MKQFVVVAALCCIGSAIALPILDTAVANGVLLEEKATSPRSFDKGFRNDCDYVHHSGRTLGHDIFAQGDDTKYETLPLAKRACDKMGPDCGGIQERSKNNQKFFQLYHGHQLKRGDPSEIVHLKTLCAFPLPHTNFQPGESEGNHNAIFVVNPVVEDLRWKLQNGPEFRRYDDGRDHGWASRLVDGKHNVDEVDDCTKLCADRSDCASGHFCAEGAPGTVGGCFLSGDWDPHGKPSDEMTCQKVQNFRKRNDWVKPVMRTDDGQYIKHQWHSKKTRDDAMAEDMLGYDYDN